MNPYQFGYLLELALMTVVCAFYFYFAFKFLSRFMKKDLFNIERKLNLGYSLWFISLGAGYSAYTLDRMWDFLYDNRIFTRYEFDHDLYKSALPSDYYIIIFFGLFLGSIFLIYVIEKHVLNKKVIIPWICVTAAVFTIILRPIEVGLLSIAPELVEYIGYILFISMALILIQILVVYIKIAKSAKNRSDLWNRAVAFVIGLIIEVVMLSSGNYQFSRGKLKELFIGSATLGPIITLIALSIMNYGFLRSKQKEVSNVEIEKIANEGDKFKQFVDMFTRPKTITEEEITYYREQKVCLVCKGKVSRLNYICPECSALYCNNCSEALSNLENACWSCNEPFDPEKPVNIQEQDTPIPVLKPNSATKGSKNNNEHMR
ncbi:MAG: B-box zinc finger protein [Candidatus Hodarchaeota archaeon]